MGCMEHSCPNCDHLQINNVPTETPCPICHCPDCEDTGSFEHGEGIASLSPEPCSTCKGTGKVMMDRTCDEW